MHDHILGGRQVTSELMAVSYLGSVLSELLRSYCQSFQRKSYFVILAGSACWCINQVAKFPWIPRVPSPPWRSGLYESVPAPIRPGLYESAPAPTRPGPCDPCRSSIKHIIMLLVRLKRVPVTIPTKQLC